MRRDLQTGLLALVLASVGEMANSEVSGEGFFMRTGSITMDVSCKTTSSSSSDTLAYPNGLHFNCILQIPNYGSYNPWASDTCNWPSPHPGNFYCGATSGMPFSAGQVTLDGYHYGIADDVELALHAQISGYCNWEQECWDFY